MTTSSKKRHTEAQEPHWLEWATGIVSAVLVLGMIGWIAAETIMLDETPPSFRAAALATTAVEDGYRMEFEISNLGTTSAASVIVRAELLEAGRPVETSEAMLDYVPGQSKAGGGMLFSRDPATLEVKVRVVAYADP